jgi:hypothetical protein
MTDAAGLQVENENEVEIGDTIKSSKVEIKRLFLSF